MSYVLGQVKEVYFQLFQHFQQESQKKEHCTGIEKGNLWKQTFTHLTNIRGLLFTGCCARYGRLVYEQSMRVVFAIAKPTI